MPICDNWIDLWRSGQEIDKECLLLGSKLIWWARWGKFVQFVSGLVILADIVGIERIRKWGKSLENLINSFNVQRVLNISPELFIALFSKLKLLFAFYSYIILGRWRKFFRLQPEVFSRNYINKAMFFALFIGWWSFIIIFFGKPFLLLIFELIQAFSNNNNLQISESIFSVIILIKRIIFFTLVFPVLAVLFWYILMIPSYFVIAIIIFVINNIFIKGIASILQQPRLHTIIQITSLILFVAGTIIDFIAS